MCNEIRHDRCDPIEGRERKRPWLIQIRYSEPLLEGVCRNTKTCPAEIRSRYFPCVSPMLYNRRKTLLRYSKISLIRLSNKLHSRPYIKILPWKFFKYSVVKEIIHNGVWKVHVHKSNADSYQSSSHLHILSLLHNKLVSKQASVPLSLIRLHLQDVCKAGTCYDSRTESYEQLFFFCMRTGNSRRRRVRW